MTRITIERILTKLTAIEKNVDMVLSEQKSLSAKVDQVKSEPDDAALSEVNITYYFKHLWFNLLILIHYNYLDNCKKCCRTTFEN